MKKQIVHSALILVCTLLTISAFARANDQPANLPSALAQYSNAVVLRFALQSGTATDSAALSQRACPSADTNSPNSGDNLNGAAKSTDLPSSVTIDAKILDGISQELQRKLPLENMTVTTDREPDTIPVGSTVIAGCIFQVQKGNAMRRMVGMGWGASRLEAHIVFLSKMQTGFVPLDSFDLEIKGRNLTPPLPMAIAIHAVREKKLTLSADGKKLADQIVKRLSSDLKEQKETA